MIYSHEITKPGLFITCIFIFIFIYACDQKPSQEDSPNTQIGEVEFTSSDSTLQQAWGWAKTTALSYVREDTIVGLWYESALPGRDAFCMRDVAHQASGAAVLGLQEHTKNMLFLFASNISESKDWCSYWEINKNNVPAPIDYKNDKDFWYNLPANFDIIDACFRMYSWTGDTDFIEHPVFKSFQHRTMNEYVDSWDLNADRLMHRQRIMNMPEGATPDNHHYYDNRGIPGYYEGAGGNMKLGIDLLPPLYAAWHWYHNNTNSDDDNYAIRLEAYKIDSLIRNEFWDSEREAFRLIYYEDGSWDYSVGNGSDFTQSLLHYNVIDDSLMIKSVLDNYSDNKESLTIELASHLPDIFFRYGRPDDGIFMLKHLTDSNTYRREYPENPFAVCGAFITGLMGISLHPTSDYIKTFSGIKAADAWTSVEALPYADGSVNLLHQGQHSSVLKNLSSDTLLWQAFFEKGHESWYINGFEQEYDGQISRWYGINVVSWMVEVNPGETVSISAQPPAQ